LEVAGKYAYHPTFSLAGYENANEKYFF